MHGKAEHTYEEVDLPGNKDEVYTTCVREPVHETLSAPVTGFP